MNAGLKRSPILNRKSTTPHANLSETELLQGNISRLAEHHRNEEARKQLEAAKQRLERLQNARLVTPNPLDRLEGFIRYAMELCDRTERTERKALMGVA